MSVFEIVGNVIYGAMGLVALWGVYCLIVVYYRVMEKKFRSDALQGEFLQAMEQPLSQGDFRAASEICADDPRALCQLSQLAVDNRSLGFNKVRQLAQDRFQRDVLSDIDHRVSWVNTVIKSAPMLGLLGTVIGMMGAFGKLAESSQVEASKLAEDIMFALITTALGLAIAIPLVLAVNSINIQIKKMEEMVAEGLNFFFEMFKEATIRFPSK
ncbi:MAG: MotA/TolQ/ExbB proton channel family protein [Pirellulaceae bacterium]|nr:MotA/TolQ/ExbB proton channel family protein [Pirellulaceae bacterium]